MALEWRAPRTTAAERTRRVQVAHYQRLYRRTHGLLLVLDPYLVPANKRLVEHARFSAWLALRELGAGVE